MCLIQTLQRNTTPLRRDHGQPNKPGKGSRRFRGVNRVQRPVQASGNPAKARRNHEERWNDTRGHVQGPPCQLFTRLSQSIPQKLQAIQAEQVRSKAAAAPKVASVLYHREMLFSSSSSRLRPTNNPATPPSSPASTRAPSSPPSPPTPPPTPSAPPSPPPTPAPSRGPPPPRPPPAPPARARR